MVAYQTSYVKANYPVEYMTALLSADSSDNEKISLAVNECRRMKIRVLPPDINESHIDFTIVPAPDSLEGKAIRFGLSAIKNVGKAAIEAILSAREAGNFQSLSDFLERVDNRKVNKKVLESIIKVGGFSSYGSRATMLYLIEQLRGKYTKKASTKGQQDLFGEGDIKSSREDTDLNLIGKSQISEFSQEEIQNLERQLLGFSLSAKPVIDLISPIAHLATHKIVEISSVTDIGKSIKIAVVVTEVRTVVTKNSGQEMAFVKVDDGTGSLNIVVFPKIFGETKSQWVDFKALLISGRVDLRDEEINLLVESINTDQTEASEEVFINIPASAGVNELKGLKELLTANPGTKKVTLIFESTHKRITLPNKIDWSEALAHRIANVISTLNVIE